MPRLVFALITTLGWLGCGRFGIDETEDRPPSSVDGGIIAARDGSASLPSTDAAPSACVSDFLDLPGTDDRFQVFPGPLRWQEAEQACGSRAPGATLLLVTDPASVQAFSARGAEITATQQTSYVWAGATDVAQEGIWRDTAGAIVDIEPWGGGEPNNFGDGEHCLVIDSNFDTYNDLGCDSSVAYACRCTP